MKKILKIIFILSIITFFVKIKIGFAYNIIDFNTYKTQLELINQKKINYNKLNKEFNKIKNNKCIKISQGNFYIITAICLYNKDYPKLGFRESINYIRPYVKGFKDEYNLYDQEFKFDGTQAIINYSQISLNNYLNKTPAQKYITYKLEQKNIKIKIHKKYFARYSIQDFDFYPVKKNLKGIGTCSLTNYKIGIDVLNNFYLLPNQILNFNKYISYLPGYCHGQTITKQPFYGGICGAAGQLFRSSLINPNITISKRYNHSKRRAKYYGKIIYGDDAAILDTRKQLEIKNTGILPIYFKVLDKGEYNYLVGILPTKSRFGVFLSKKQIGNLSAKVIKKIYNKPNNKIKQTQTFKSQYYSISNASV